MRKRKKAILLIEVILCLGLISIMISSLFFWYRTIGQQREQFSRLKKPLIEERYAHQRLQYLFASAAAPFFSSSDGGLVFIFDRGLFPESKLSGKVLTKIFFDSKHRQICLGIWPYPQKETCSESLFQMTTLLDHVIQCDFEYYHPPDLFGNLVDPEQVGKSRPQEGWQSNWLASYASLPAFVKLTINREGSEKEVEYWYDLPADIIYPKESA